MLRVEMPDGTVQRFTSGTDWKTATGQSDLTWFEKDFDDQCMGPRRCRCGRSDKTRLARRGRRTDQLAGAKLSYGQSGAQRSHLFHGSWQLSVVFEREKSGRRFLGARMDRL